jgi:hypothetical protein
MNIQIPHSTRLNLAKLPVHAEVSLYLISEEMKNRRCINRLETVGFDLTYACDLSRLILTLAGFEERSDELYDWYTQTLDEACNAADPSDVETWRENVFEFYLQLVRRREE